MNCDCCARIYALVVGVGVGFAIGGLISLIERSF
jgi:hypothetical protein